MLTERGYYFRGIFNMRVVTTVRRVEMGTFFFFFKRYSGKY